MKLESYMPSPLLAPYIQEYKIIASHDTVVNRILPGMAPVLAFRIQGQVNYLAAHREETLPSLALTGLKKTVRLIHYTPDSTNILVLFKVGTAALFFGEPMHHFFEGSVSLENFIPKGQLSDIEEQFAAAKDHIHRIALIEKFLLSRLQPSPPDQLIQAATQKIYETKGIYPIKALTDSLHISQDAFEKRFRKIVGATPKQFSAIIRMKSILASPQKEYSFTKTALAAGFFDQSHFNKDFKLFTGLTPSDFYQSPSFW